VDGWRIKLVKKHSVQGTSSFMRSVLEQDFTDNPNYWVCVYDSSKYPDGSARRCHTRVYQLKLGGILWDIGFKFVYDYEEDKAVCRFDILAEGALKHIKAGNFDEAKFKEALFRKDIKEVRA